MNQENQNQNQNQDGQYHYQNQNNGQSYQHSSGQGTFSNSGASRNGVPERNIVTCILLSIFTCGIYPIIWMYNIEEDSAALTGEPTGEGGKVILFSLLTCGIYYYIWLYKLGKERLPKITGNDNSLMYILLSLFGLGIVTYALIQTDLNNYINGSRPMNRSY